MILFLIALGQFSLFYSAQGAICDPRLLFLHCWSSFFYYCFVCLNDLCLYNFPRGVSGPVLSIHVAFVLAATFINPEFARNSQEVFFFSLSKFFETCNFYLFCTQFGDSWKVTKEWIIIIKFFRFSNLQRRNIFELFKNFHCSLSLKIKNFKTIRSGTRLRDKRSKLRRKIGPAYTFCYSSVFQKNHYNMPRAGCQQISSHEYLFELKIQFHFDRNFSRRRRMLLELYEWSS